MGKEKRDERSSSSSSETETKKVRLRDDMAEETSSEPAALTSLESIASGIKALNEEMKQNFKQLNDELIVLKIEMKREMEEIKKTTRKIEKSLESARAVIEDLREEDQKQKVTQNQQNAEVEAIKREVYQLKNELEKEKERNIALKNYTRRESIRIVNKIITIQEAASGSKLNRVFYSLLLKNIATVPQKSQLKWARDPVACQKNEIHKIDNIDWKTVYSISFSCTSSTSLRTFHFKYLHRRIPTNTFLMKCKISPTEKCTFCKSEPETTIHLFFQCSYVNVFWQTIIR